ncbi:hypothetical protein HDA32_006082 [Spinactinospora alkalitolerans]|uniref:Uncharacterized protein n=1 Tax=Spinactinospora alkalitolerans TaxID=687207 RepID=A0A852U637_9ACTN|nr:hypothetical protein [Spinactinospora alkalitolerans]NYE50962.1 hypothetical protein [Spinactinospora alkalitolerans]
MTAEPQQPAPPPPPSPPRPSTPRWVWFVLAGAIVIAFGLGFGTGWYGFQAYLTNSMNQAAAELEEDLGEDFAEEDAQEGAEEEPALVEEEPTEDLPEAIAQGETGSDGI